jgi:hypothetical protein
VNLRRPSFPTLAWPVTVLVAGMGSAWVTASSGSGATYDGPGTTLRTALGVVTLCVACAGLGWLLQTSLHPRRDVQPPPTAAGVGQDHLLQDHLLQDRLLQDRRCLVRLCLDLHDATERPALRERIARTLADAGVTAIVPLGDVFDPDHDEAVTTVVTDDPSLFGRVASVERAGFRDGDQLLRPAEVAVYVRPQSR